MIEELSEMYFFAIFYGIMMCVVWAHLYVFSKKDMECRYTDPKEWSLIWVISIAVFLINAVYLLPYHPDWFVASLVWVVITYLLAKLPPIKILGGNDARVLICAGLMFPHWLTIPAVFCSAIIIAHIQKKRGTDEMREDWKRRGIPMLPFLSIGWLISAFIFQNMCYLF